MNEQRPPETLLVGLTLTAVSSSPQIRLPVARVRSDAALDVTAACGRMVRSDDV